MSDRILRVVADCARSPLAVVGSDGKVALTNKALRLVLDEVALESGFRRRQPNGRFTLPTRTGGDITFDVIATPDETDSWVVRGEEASIGTGLAENPGSFVTGPIEGQTILGLHLARAAQRALEQDRAVALFFLEFLGLGHVDRDNGAAAALDATARLDERLRANLRAVDVMLPQDDGTRAVVAVVTNADGAAVVANRLSGALGRPLPVNGTERVFGARIGLAYSNGPDVAGLEAAARAALEQAEASRRPFFSMASRETV